MTKKTGSYNERNFILLYSVFILLFSILGCSSKKNNYLSQSDSVEKQAAEYCFKNIQVIDHWNLRYYKRYDIFTLNEQVSQIKANMDVAEELGFNSYLLFQKDAFQELLTWGGKHKPDEELKNAIKAVISYGKQKGLDVYLHSNQFAWPEDVGVDFKDSKESWQVFENAMKELIETFPDVAGYQVTGDETGGQLDTKEGLLKFHNLTAKALKSDGRERIAFMRTWQRCGFLGVPENELGVGDEPNLIYSIKNTQGDFTIANGLDTEFIKEGVDGTRLLVEFDAWREYETHNIFPIYLGDYWAHFCKKYFHEDTAAAFNMYKNTFNFIETIYYKDGEKFFHHGGLRRPRGEPVELEKVTQAYDKMKRLIDKLPDSNQYKKELQKYCLVISYLGRVAAGDNSIVDDWKNLDRESFKELEARNAAKW